MFSWHGDKIDKRRTKKIHVWDLRVFFLTIIYDQTRGNYKDANFMWVLLEAFPEKRDLCQKYWF